MKQMIKADYNGLQVEFTEEGWFNATAAAERFGKAPHEWVRLPETERYIAALERKYGKIPYLKTRRGAHGGTWLHPKLAVRFAQWLDIDFAVWCDEQIDALLRGTHQHHDWKRLRHAAASTYKVMSAVLQMQRSASGKETGVVHYMNEARLVNWALTGRFCSVDRASLNESELDALAKLEELNSVLLGSGVDYETRKKALQAMAANYRQLLMSE